MDIARSAMPLRPTTMQIALAAHGRFHAFDFARELATHGHRIGLFTNYPAPYVERWGVPHSGIRAYPVHGAAARLARRLGSKASEACEPELHRWFGRAAARRLARERWDAVICWSGVGEEILQGSRFADLRVCHRTSAHIRTQDRLLREEEQRTGITTERPSAWMIAREEREYALADRILVPSTFARDTFIAEGVEPERLLTVPLGVDVGMFRPSEHAVAERVRRVRSGEPLQVACIGTLSLRKGLWDVLQVAESLRGANVHISWTGPVSHDARPLLARLARVVTILPPLRQHDLPSSWSRADVFLLPTIEDGFGMVVSQALASAVPVVCSANSCAQDIIDEGVTGWVVPIRNPESLIDRLRWCITHRNELAGMSQSLFGGFRPRTWADAATDLAIALETACASGGSHQAA